MPIELLALTVVLLTPLLVAGACWCLTRVAFSPRLVQPVYVADTTSFPVTHFPTPLDDFSPR